MPKVFLVFLLLLTPGAAQPLSAATRGVAVVPLTEVEPASYGALKDQSYGVFVGINQFQDEGIQPLRFPAADARAMRDCFVHELGYLKAENTRLLVSEEGADQPDRVSIIRAIKWAATSAGPEGCVVVQISTHGVEGYVLSEDSFRDSLKETAVELAWVEETLKESRSRKRLLIFDACREKWTSDQSGEKAVAGGMAPLFAEAFSKAEGFVTLKSCSQGQYSYEMEETGHGAFTHFLLEGLRGAAPPSPDGLITVTELGKWVRDQVESWSRNRGGGVQSPLISIFESTGDLPLALSKKHLDALAQEEREELLRRLAKMFADSQLNRDQLRLAEAAIESDDPGGHKVVKDLLEGKVSPEYLERLLASREPRPSTPSLHTRSPEARKNLELVLGHYLGIGMETNPTLAREILIKTADGGDPVARLRRAWFRSTGNLMFERNAAEANAEAAAVLADVIRLAEAGDAQAAACLGTAFRDGVGVAQNTEQAKNWYLKALETSDVVAMIGMGNMAELGKDYSEAEKWYRKAAESGVAAAWANVGVLYENGVALERNDAMTLECFQKGAEAGDPRAVAFLAGMYQAGRGVPKDASKAAELYAQAAESGYSIAYTNLGILHENGLGVPKDESKAAELYLKGAEAGDREGMTNLGILYQLGRGVPKDEAKAAEWYRKGADAGDPDSMTNLGHLYRDGVGVAKDLAKALEWYQKGADGGDPAGMASIGYMYEYGLGVPRDAAQGAEWYRKGAEGGNVTAMRNMGLMYEYGSGVPLDVNVALEWYKKAADLGDQQAAEALLRLGPRFTDGGNGVVTDNHTGLLWLKDPGGAGLTEGLTLTDAVARCESLEYAGFSDWRLPTYAELTQLKAASPQGALSLKPSTYWSLDANKDEISTGLGVRASQYVHFGTGSDGTGYASQKRLVIPVRP